jgi:hypothetical protein
MKRGFTLHSWASHGRKCSRGVRAQTAVRMTALSSRGTALGPTAADTMAPSRGGGPCLLVDLNDGTPLPRAAARAKNDADVPARNHAGAYHVDHALHAGTPFTFGESVGEDESGERDSVSRVERQRPLERQSADGFGAGDVPVAQRDPIAADLLRHRCDEPRRLPHVRGNEHTSARPAGGLCRKEAEHERLLRLDPWEVMDLVRVQFVVVLFEVRDRRLVDLRG